MSIPTIPGTSQIRTQQIGVKRNLSVEEAPLNAARGTIRAATGAVQDVAGDVIDYELRKQRAEEVAAFNQAAITMNKVTSGYRDSIRHATTEDQIDAIVPSWQQVAKETKDQILGNQKLSAPAQAKLRNSLERWEGDSTAEFQTAADIKGSQRRKAVATTAYHEFLSTGDPAMMKNAAAAIDGAVKVGDMDPAQGQYLKAQMGEKMAEAQALNGITSNPYRTLQDLKAGKFSDIKNPNRLRELTTEANARANANQGQQVQAYMEQIATAKDPTQYPLEEQLDSDVKAGKLSARGANNLRNLMKKQGAEDSRNRGLVLDMQVHDHDWDADRDFEESARKMKDEAAALPPQYAKPVMEYIDRQVGALRKKQATPKPSAAENSLLARGKQNYADGLFQAPDSSGNPATVDRKWRQPLAGEKASDTESRGRAADLNYAEWQTAIRAYFRQNPDATDEQAEKYSQSILRQHVDAHVQAALGLAPKQFVRGQIYRDANGNRARWTGDAWEEVK